MIKLKCAGCGAALRIPDNKAGKKGRCPHCGLVVDIPAAGEVREGPLAAGSALDQLAGAVPKDDSQTGEAPGDTHVLPGGALIEEADETAESAPAPAEADKVAAAAPPALATQAGPAIVPETAAAPRKGAADKRPRYAGLRGLNIVLKVAGAFYALAGAFTAVELIVRYGPALHVMRAAVPAVTKVLLGLVLFGLGDLCLCIRDIAMNTEAARRRQ